MQIGMFTDGVAVGNPTGLDTKILRVTKLREKNLISSATARHVDATCVQFSFSFTPLQYYYYDSSVSCSFFLSHFWSSTTSFSFFENSQIKHYFVPLSDITYER